MEHETSDELSKFALICWSIWIARNNVVFNGYDENTDDILARADRMLSSYQVLLCNSRDFNARTTSHKKWECWIAQN